MTINIRAVGMELTPAIREYVEEKMTSVEKFIDGILIMDVDIGLDTQHHNKGEIYSCSVTVQLPGDVIKVEKTEKNLYKAIDKVKDHLRESVIKAKEKKRDERRQG
ncbi:MAG: ribosome-associated translation inhibitor RaiA [Patescibacteria group bacterium]